jgi:hypothetical protein
LKMEQEVVCLQKHEGICHVLKCTSRKLYTVDSNYLMLFHSLLSGGDTQISSEGSGLEFAILQAVYQSSLQEEGKVHQAGVSTCILKDIIFFTISCELSFLLERNGQLRNLISQPSVSFAYTIIMGYISGYFDMTI